MAIFSTKNFSFVNRNISVLKVFRSDVRLSNNQGSLSAKVSQAAPLFVGIKVNIINIFYIFSSKAHDEVID